MLYHNLVDIINKVINKLEVMYVAKGKEQLREALIIGCQTVKQARSFRFKRHLVSKDREYDVDVEMQSTMPMRNARFGQLRDNGLYELEQ